MNIGVYITGHCFGHAARMTEIMNRIGKTAPDSCFYLRTSVPQWFFRQSLAEEVQFRHENIVIDVGVVQHNVFRPAKKKTLLAFERFWSERKSLEEHELAFFKSIRPSLILGDIPPLAFEIAEMLGVKSIAIGNFSWDWIYRSYAAHYPEFDHLIGRIRKAYSCASLLLRLPLSDGLSAFPSVRDIPLVARAWKTCPEKVRSRLNIPCGRPVVLITFGGFGMDNLFLKHCENIPGYTFITAFPSQGSTPSCVRYIREDDLFDSGITFPDLINASDMVVGKPGYGMVSECIANRKPFIYTSRGDFAEYPVLVKEMKKHLPSVYIPQRDLFSGKWKSYLEKAASMTWPLNPMPVNGSEIAAQEIIRFQSA